MAYDIMTLEVYKFAASSMNKGLGEVSRLPELSVFDTIKIVGIARKVIDFLGEAKNDANAQRLSSTLDILTKQAENLVSERAKKSPNEVQNAQRLVEHGVKGIPYANASIYYYAGRRLEAFVDERIADGSADRSLYEHCKGLKERISEFLGMFIASHQSSSSPREGRGNTLANGRVDRLCGICTDIQSYMTPQLRELLVNLDAALLKIEQYVTSSQPTS